MPAWGLIPDSPVLTGGSKYIKGISRGIRSGGSTGTAYKSPITMNLSLSKVVLYQPVLNRELHFQGGITWRYMDKLGDRIVRGAKRQVGYKTGALRKSIYMTHRPDVTGQSIKIGSLLSYAYLHHEGTRPHIIMPKEAGGVLQFTKGSRVIRTSLVRHPGTNPNRFLSDQLRIHVPR